MSELADLITPAERQAVRAPIESARTLPRAAFTSDAFFQLEVERIFARGWAALALADQVPEAGDLLPVDFCGMPLLLVRGRDDAVRVFHNVVPYDGCLAVIDPLREASEIVTPYHGWRYDLRGHLLATPWWDGTREGGRPEAGDLAAVRSETSAGVVFVDLGGRAGSFDGFIAPLRCALSEYALDEMEVGRDAQGAPLLGHEDLATNWKTHYENWGINVLHESFVHDLYAAARDGAGELPRVDESGRKTYVDLIDGGLMALQFREKDFHGTYPPETLPFAHLGVSDSPPELGFFGSLFPNLHFGVLPGLVHWIVALPDGPGRTRTARAQFLERGSARDPALVEARLGLRAGFEEAGAEDGRITESVQRARRSPAFPSQFYSPFWDVMHHAFSGRVLDALEG